MQGGRSNSPLSIFKVDFLFSHWPCNSEDGLRLCLLFEKIVENRLSHFLSFTKYCIKEQIDPSKI